MAGCWAKGGPQYHAEYLVLHSFSHGCQSDWTSIILTCPQLALLLIAGVQRAVSCLRRFWANNTHNNNKQFPGHFGDHAPFMCAFLGSCHSSLRNHHFDQVPLEDVEKPSRTAGYIGGSAYAVHRHAQYCACLEIGSQSSLQSRHHTHLRKRSIYAPRPLPAPAPAPPCLSTAMPWDHHFGDYWVPFWGDANASQNHLKAMKVGKRGCLGVACGLCSMCCPGLQQ